jgi:phage terminase large subunit-like protein
MRSGAVWLASATQAQVDDFLSGLSDEALLALPWIFEFWALPHQLPPEGAWRTWVIMGGRGAGKTRAGAEWVRAEVEGARPEDPGRSSRVALVGETQDQVREVMVMGESGILACTPPDRRPVWEATRRRLVWPNGAVAQCFSAHDPDSLRGPQFDAAWVDELAKWKRSEDTWDMLQFALRLGGHPRQVVTTTPQNVGVLKAILRNPSTVVTHAPTEANRAYLAASFLEEVKARYGAAAGLVAVVKNDRLTAGGRVVELWEALRAPLEPGDAVRLEAGCDKRAETCRLKFSNFMNFRGFPHVPGEDWLTAYPVAAGANDGGSLGG